MIRTIIIDDHKLFADGIARLLNDAQRFEVVSKFNSGISFLQALPIDSVDLVIIDVDMPMLSGFDVIRRLRSQNKTVKVVVVSMHETLAYSNEAAELGANGYLVKSLDSDALVTRLERIMDGENFFLKKVKTIETVSLLSKRETEVLQLMAKGKTSDEISGLLNISTVTVKAHRTNIFRKLEVKNAAELIMKAFHLGLL
jgi:DNA-binding NarL/FixJ family response regulator